MINLSLPQIQDIRLSDLLREILRRAVDATTGAPLFVDQTNQRIGIGTKTPDASSFVDMESTAGGLLVPRMTTAQKTAVARPATGLMVFDNTIGDIEIYNGTAWVNTSMAGNGDTIARMLSLLYGA